MKTFLIHGEIYSFSIRICIEADVAKMAKWINKKWKLPSAIHHGYNEEDFEDVRGLMLDYSSYHPCIWLPKEPETAEEIAIAVHELLHATIKVMRHVQIPLSAESEEAYTYLISHLTEQFFTKINQKTCQQAHIKVSVKKKEKHSYTKT